MKLTKVIDDMEKPIIDLLSENAELKPKVRYILKIVNIEFYGKAYRLIKP